MIKRGWSTILKDESTYKYCYREDQIESTKGEKPHKINIIIAKKLRPATNRFVALCACLPLGRKHTSLELQLCEESVRV
jgi:hypothetical protein